ncbi:hypothetical protein [Butyrivibrio sp. VCB2001]|uniref:hypothetical protein n=1 Tax=Butyrivibrio sp. VCB2001 TaxID=1280667 RepID=UPI0003F76622|nr:hypothetical protein [Butyrivibrio sp. VCB2001]
MILKRSNSNITFIIYAFLLFVGLFIFLTSINPLVVYDADDWLYIAQFRLPIPMIGYWNPIKVFPETFMPAVSCFGALVINPITHNYCFSLTLAHGLFCSFLLTLYFTEFSLMFYRKKIASQFGSIGYGLLFILLHFITYVHSGSNNIYSIWAPNLTSFYNYTLSAIINATLVIHCISYGSIQTLFDKSSLFKKIVLLIWIYFAIFSNLFSSVILAAYIGAELLYQLISDIRAKKFDIKNYCKRNILNLLIIIFWFFSNYLETTGGNAAMVGIGSLTGNISQSLVYGLGNLIIINVFITIFGLIVGIVWIKKCGRKSRSLILFVLYQFLAITYMIMLSAATRPYYIVRAEITIGIFFYFFIGLIYCLSDLVARNSKNLRLLFILSGTLILLFINPGKVFFAYNNSNISYSQCEALMNDIIDQVRSAEKNGSGEVVLYVPAYDTVQNWPIADFMGDYISIALCRHHITDKYIFVKELVPTTDKNVQFGISDHDLEKNLYKPYLILD